MRGHAQRLCKKSEMSVMMNRGWKGTMFFEESWIELENWRRWMIHQLLPRA